MELTHKQISISAEDIGERTIRFCISNEKQDRDGDIVIAAGCDLTNFNKNPQFLPFHNNREFPLGIPKKTWIDSAAGKVYSDVYFPTVEELSTNPEQASEKAKLVDFTYKCYKTGMLSAVSVSFYTREKEQNPNSEHGNIITKWELLEFSAVPLPSNQDALAVAAKSAGLSEAQRKMFEPEIKAGRKLSAATISKLQGIKKECDKMSGMVEEIMSEQASEGEPEPEPKQAPAPAQKTAPEPLPPAADSDSVLDIEAEPDVLDITD